MNFDFDAEAQTRDRRYYVGNHPAKFYLRSLALSTVIKAINGMPTVTDTRLPDILEMLQYVNKMVQVLEPHGDMGYDLPTETMESLLLRLPPFLRMQWRELVKRGEGSPNDMHRLRNWLVKKAIDKLTETLELLEKEGYTTDEFLETIQF